MTLEKIIKGIKTHIVSAGLLIYLTSPLTIVGGNDIGTRLYREKHEQIDRQEKLKLSSLNKGSLYGGVAGAAMPFIIWPTLSYLLCKIGGSYREENKK